ncbi:MAG TPA: MerR family DNA-binding transcriptional regulator [Solirubrobacteraceae bacterium]|nr:MerR family DNA-binding transcriptional regulator [Solirubrobacteraceae bacterium]
MTAIRTNAAAAMLGVSPNTLRSWERRFGYPRPQRTQGGHRQFELAEIEALRQAFSETGDIVSSVSIARERGEGPSSPMRLQAALSEFREDAADRVLEESLAVRSVERTVESVLLSAVELLEPGSPERAFARRYAAGWLAAATRVAPCASREEGTMILDASAPAGVDGLYVQALELFLRRRGLRVLTLTLELEPARVGAALRALRPGALVLAGAAADATPQRLSRLVYAARRAEPGIAIFDYRAALAQGAASTVTCVGPGALDAAEQLRERLTGVVLPGHAASAS